MKNRSVRYLYFAISISLLPYLWLFTQTSKLGGFKYAWPNIVGLIAATLMLWQFLLGIRHISRKLTSDYVAILKLHKFLGVYGILLVFLHPMGEMLSYSFAFDFIYSLNLSNDFQLYVSFGRAAYALFIIIYVTSAILRKKIRFRPWQYIHYLTYPMLAGIFIHAINIGRFINSFPLIRTYWQFMAVTFFAVVLWRLLKFFNVGKIRYLLTDKVSNKNGVTFYTFLPNGKKIIPKVGQFVFIRPSFFGEVHPFTVMKFAEDTGELTFGIKAIGRFTHQLEKLEKGSVVYMDGPYGVFTQQGQNEDPKVIFAGGIGVTPFVELISRFGGKQTYMFYSNKYLKDSVGREEFMKELSANYKDIISREIVSHPSVISGRMDTNMIIKHLPKNIIERAKYFVCGSPRYMAGITSSLKELGVPPSRIFIEEFGF